jgi:Holliday junction resolvase
MKETDLGVLLSKNRKEFEALFDLMSTSRPARVFFLSSLEETRRKEEPPVPTLDELQRILTEEEIPSSKAEKIVKEIAETVSIRIAERRAVSARVGSFGLITPFDESKREPKAALPFIRHIYSSYFSNFFAILDVLNQLHPIKPSEVEEVFCAGDGKVGDFVEKLYLCEECTQMSNVGDERCDHEKIYLSLFKLKDAILRVWEQGAILCGYLAHVLQKAGWDTRVEQEICGTNDVFHQIDVIAEKRDRIILIECKQYSPTIPMRKEDVMKALGIMDDIENTIQEMAHKKKEVRKAVAITSILHEKITGISKRKDIFIIGRDMLLEESDKWVWKI